MELLTSQVERQANKHRLREAELLLSRYGRNGPRVYFGVAQMGSRFPVLFMFVYVE